MTERTVTERLRKLLDERGVEYEAERIDFSNYFTWGENDCYSYTEYPDGTVLRIWDCTPEQAIAATLGRPKAKSHPYGYERDTGSYDCTRCECGCINDISATYCNDCGGEIEIDESAEKEYYDGYSKHTVFAKKHDDGSLEFCERRYIPEDAATQGSGTLTAEQVWRAVDQRSVCVPEEGDKEWQAIADELNATLGSGTCHDVYPKAAYCFTCSECGHIRRFVQGWNNATNSSQDEFNYCPNCGRKVKR